MKQLREEALFIAAGSTILDAMRAITEGCHKTALVVDGDRRLLGVVTDADLRKGLLAGEGLDCPVEKVMNVRPITADASWPRARLMQHVRRTRRAVVPVIDGDGRVVRVATLNEAVNLEVHPNEVVLFAGGLGKRLAPHTNTCPKPLLKVGPKPILEIILENFISQGFRNFWISVNYLADMIVDHFGDGSRWDVKIGYLRENSALGTAGALSLLPHRPTHPLIVMNGDILAKVDFSDVLSHHGTTGSAATMCARRYEYVLPYGVAQAEGGVLTAIREKPRMECLVNAGIYVVDPRMLNYVEPGLPTDMPDVINTLAANGNPVGVYELKDYWLDIGEADHYAQACADYTKLFPGVGAADAL